MAKITFQQLQEVVGEITPDKKDDILAHLVSLDVDEIVINEHLTVCRGNFLKNLETYTHLPHE